MPDFGEDDEEFLDQLRAWKAVNLEVRQISRLASLCRCHQALGYDFEIDELLAATRKSDSSDEWLSGGYVASLIAQIP